MKIAVVQFPGSNCDLDMLNAVRDVLGEQAAYVWHKETTLKGFDAVFLPGGFSYGDYLRAGAIAKFSNIMKEVREFAKEGRPVLGVCNGFQILTECGLLPGTLIQNANLHFTCKTVPLEVVNNETMFTSLYKKGETIRIPIAHGEGNYYCDQEALEKIEANNQVVFRYKKGNNPNGSVADIAGIVNERGNVLGMMPHPERAVEPLIGGVDGLKLFQSVLKTWKGALYR